MPDGTAHPEVQSGITSARGGGASLDAGAPGRIAPALGDDLSDVRVHTDQRADDLARLGVGPRVHHRHRRLLRERRVPARVVVAATSCSHTSSPTWCSSAARRRRAAAVSQPGDALEVDADRAAQGARGADAVSDGLARPALRRARRRACARAVESVAATDPNPVRPVPRPLRLRRPRARLARTGAPRRLDARLTRRRSGSASTCSTPRCWRSAPRRSSTPATAACSPTCRTTSRASWPARGSSAACWPARAHPADVLAVLRAPTGRCAARRGALLDQGSGPTPLAERGAKVAERLAGVPADRRVDGTATATRRLRVVPPPPYDPGRRGATSRDLRALLGAPSHIPLSCSPGPTPPALLAVALGQPVLLAPVTDALDREPSRDAALAAALARGPLVFDGLERLEPADRTARRPRAARAHGARARCGRRTRGAATALGDAAAFALDAPMPTLRASAATPGPRSRAPTTRATRRPSSGSRWARSPRPPRSPRIAAATRGDERRRRTTSTTAPGGLREPRSATSPRGWSRASRGTTSCCRRSSTRCCAPSRPTCATATWCSRAGATSAAVAQHQGLKVLFAGESGHRQDDGRAGARARARPRALPLDLATVVSKYIGETEKNLDRVFAAAAGLQRDPLLRRGRRALRQALRGPGRARPLRQHRGRVPAAEDGDLRGRGHPGHEPPAQHRRGVPAPARLRDRLPVPRAGRPRAHLALLAAGRGAAGRATSTWRSWPQQFKLSGGAIRNASLAAAFLAAEDGGVIGMRAPRARRRAGVPEARPPDDRGRLRAVPRADPLMTTGTPRDALLRWRRTSDR